MKGLTKWWQYQRIMYKLNKAKRKEFQMSRICYDFGIDYDDVNLRSINAKMIKVDKLWLSNNVIN